MTYSSALVVLLVSLWVLSLCGAAYFAKTPIGQRIARALGLDDIDQ